MPSTVLILDPTPGSLDDLRHAFEAVVDTATQVVTLHDMHALADRLDGDLTRQLVVVHDTDGDGKQDGFDVAGSLRATHPDTPVVLAADRGSVELAARAVDAGAADLIVRGERLEERVATLMGKMSRLLGTIDRNRKLDDENAQLRGTIQARYPIVGESPQIEEMVAQIERVASVPRPVLIIGERGTGKELVARAIHSAGGLRDRPIVTVNCAAFSDALLESELFGHERGAFTGADTQRIGKFEQADHGTLFLDEIGHMSLPFQQKILRVVEYGRFTRVGGHEELSTSARIIAATNSDLQKAIRAGDFLPDLYDRLSFDVVQVPPLRDRRGDVDVLARHFLNQFALEIPAFGGKKLATSALRVLRQYPFPGNVRELKNIIERAACRDVTNEITPVDIGMLPDAEPVTAEGDFHEKVDRYRRRLIRSALRQAGGNQAQAARLLGLTYDQFRHYFRKFEAGDAAITTD